MSLIDLVNEMEEKMFDISKNIERELNTVLINGKIIKKTMKIKINTPLIEQHEFLKLYSGILYLGNEAIGYVWYNKNIERCVELRDELDEDIKQKLKTMIEKWVEDSKKFEKTIEQAKKKDLNEKLRNILKL